MPHETHIVRFKVVSIACQAMPDGQQYTIYYRRGDTSRSTPCYVARKGVVDFSPMPEGAAVIHFKSGHAGRRYAPKYIQLRIEEYTRGAPRRTVGELEVDCSLACANNSNMGGRLLQVNFRLYGVEAKMTIAVLVYPERAPPLSFEGLVAPSADTGSKAEEPQGEVKVMGRGEAMTLLISLETMLERRQSEEASGRAQRLSRPEKRLRELEERRKTLTGSEGFATRVVTARCEECIQAQFVALARKTRNNYIGATAAYLRQLALQSGVPLTGDDAAEETMDEDTMREQLTRSNRRINELKQQVRQLEEQQSALGRLQHKMDVTQELVANLDKVAAIDAQVKLLEQSKEALTAALRSRGDSANTPINREVREINERVKSLTGEQEQLRAKVKHMTAIAARHVLSWARAKNPPEPVQPKTNVDDLFRDASGNRSKGGNDSKVVSDDQRKQILSAFQGLRPSAPPATARSSSASSSSGHRTPRDIFSGVPGLPSMGDFTDKPKEEKPAYQDPLKPAGLGTGMFADKPQQSANDRSGGGGGEAARSEPVFDFAAIMRQAEDALGGGRAGAGSGGGMGGGGGGGGGFSLEPTGPPTFTAQPATQPPVTFGNTDDSPYGSASPIMASNNASLGGMGGAAAPSGPVTANKADDPYYDDIDDYTVPPDTGIGGAATVEFDSDFNFGGGGGGSEDAVGVASKPASSPAPSSAKPTPAPRPTFNFGPADDDSAGVGGNSTFGGFGGAAGTTATTPGFSIEGAPTFSFGGGDDDAPATSSGEGGMNSVYRNLPTYNFGS